MVRRQTRRMTGNRCQQPCQAVPPPLHSRRQVGGYDRSSADPMGEGKTMCGEEDDGASAAIKILQETNRLLEKKRRRAEARKLRRLMKNCTPEVHPVPDCLELLQETQVEVDLDLDESEAEKLRKLREMEQEIAAGLLLTHEPAGSLKYEAPVITQLRAVETVDELYQLADKIVRIHPSNSP